MKFNKYIKRLPALSLIMMLLCAGIFLSSCEDEEPISEDVVLESFGPSGVKHGEQIKFIGLNLDKVSGIVLQGAGEIPKADFDSQSASLIELTVPQAATAGRVTLKTPKGDLESKAMLSFEVPVEIESITAEARPGADITIKGKMVNWIEEVTFEGGTVVTEFVSSSLNELVVTVPMEAQTGFLIFASGGTEPLSFVSDEELIVTLPAATALDPAAIRHTENLTIKGTDLDLVTGVMFEGVEEAVTEFESQSATAIVVAVPATAVKGTLTLQQASPVDVVTSQELTIILPVGTAIVPSPAGPGLTLTITGTDLDLVKEIIFPGVDAPVTSFESQSSTEIVVISPEEAVSTGALFFITTHDFRTASGVLYRMPPVGGGDTPLYTVYDDALHADWAQWGGWGTAEQDFANGELPKSGEKSIKATFNDAYGAIQLHPNSPDPYTLESFTSIKISVAGGSGTVEGTPMMVYIKTKEGTGEDSKVTINLGAPNQYKTFDILLSDLGNPANINELVFQNSGTEGDVTFYIDDIGFFAGSSEPEPLHAIYIDALHADWGKWDGWGTPGQDLANGELPKSGDNSIKITFNDAWGGFQLHPNEPDPFTLESYTSLKLSVAGGSGTAEGTQVLVYIKTKEGTGEDSKVTLDMGAPNQYKTFDIPLSDFGNPANINELVIQNGGTEGEVTFYIDDIGLF